MVDIRTTCKFETEAGSFDEYGEDYGGAFDEETLIKQSASLEKGPELVYDASEFN